VPNPVESLLAAAAAGDVKQVRAILEAAPELRDATDAVGKNALHLAAEHDQVDVARLMLELGSSVDAETDWGATPLQWAGILGSANVGRVLIEAGAVPTLYDAAGLGRIDLVRGFFEGGGPHAGAAGPGHVQLPDGSSVKTPPTSDPAVIVSEAFYLACRNGNIDIARMLLARGAEIDYPGYFGAPGLHWAAINGHGATVRWLLDEGADAAIRDTEFGTDAAGWAREGDQKALADLLSKAPAS
jgi:ankyrin repeat protein